MVRILLYLNFSNSCSGVDNRKYLHEGRDRAGIDAIAKANDEQDFVKREEIYAKYREALQHQIRFVLSFKILQIINQLPWYLELPPRIFIRCAKTSLIIPATWQSTFLGWSMLTPWKVLWRKTCSNKLVSFRVNVNIYLIHNSTDLLVIMNKCNIRYVSFGLKMTKLVANNIIICII